MRRSRVAEAAGQLNRFRAPSPFTTAARRAYSCLRFHIVGRTLHEIHSVGAADVGGFRIELGDGWIVRLDDEDAEWAAARSWRLWRRIPEEPFIAVCDETAHGRRYRVRLHREVAVRADPGLAAFLDRLRVRPRNGDHLDVRRSNLEARLARQVGPPRRDGRPHGWAYLAAPRSEADRGPSPDREGSLSPCWAGGAYWRRDGRRTRADPNRAPRRLFLGGWPVDADG